MPMIFIGVLLNTLSFGLMGFTNKQSGVPHLLPKFLISATADSIMLLLYLSSFIVILFSPIHFLARIGIAIALQFFINHVIWGLVVGTIAGLDARRRTAKHTKAT